ncbi:MAG: hypothetical protein H6634_07755 [Anaerolineales bacterium]|nr:hypothetical protein [Anaerolineales bacterium]MCB9111130.1 hypothetical protein [Anaerolineales bacterium]
MDTGTLVNMLFSGGTALAGLILVFLGGVINAYESFEPTAREFVQPKYRLRAWISLIGFLFSILSALSALAWYWMNLPILTYISLTAILIAFAVLIAIAILAVKEV